MIGLQREVICPNCNKQYNENNLPRILTTCGHTYCEVCITGMITNYSKSNQIYQNQIYCIECPEDKVKTSFSSKELQAFPKNLALIRVLQKKKANASFKEDSINISKITKKQQIQEEDETTDLISVINECKYQSNFIDNRNKTDKNDESISQNRKLKSRQRERILSNSQDDEICLLHQKNLEIICIRDNQKICSKCAIFGEHKGHQFKSIEEVQAEANRYYLEILQIFKQKQETVERMCSKETESGLLQILAKKKDLIQRQVKDEFKKLKEQISRQEKVVLRRFQQTSRETEKKIKLLLAVQKNFLDQFSSWEIESYELLKILQEREIESKIPNLYSKQQKNERILQKGQQILQKIQKQQKSLAQKVQEILVHLSCRKNNKIYQNIPDFIVIQDKPLEKIEKKNLLKPENQKQQMMTVSTLIIVDCSKQKIDGSNCTLIDAFTSANKCLEGSPLLEQSLLEGQKEEIRRQSTARTPNKVNNFEFKTQSRLPLKDSQKTLQNKNLQQETISCGFISLEVQSVRKNPDNTVLKKTQYQQSQFLLNSKGQSFRYGRPGGILKKQNCQKPNKKKLKTIRISEKYQKVLEGIFNNTVDTIDLTNAEVGDQVMIQICQFVQFSKARTIKFIRNKLSDQVIQRIVPFLGNAQILNLSQNNLTEAVIEMFMKHRHGYLSGLKNLILSQNKIIERKHKIKIDQLRAMNLVVSV